MSTDIINDRITIKDMIFTKALPSYTIPVPTDGYKVYSCKDCGDKHCMEVIVFYNRCKLLSHIRCHAFKSATIAVSDLKLEPLPLEHFNLSILKSTQRQLIPNTTDTTQVNFCYECNKAINKHGVIYKDRAAHYMQHTKTTQSCPICLFLLPSVCALEAHLRIHLNIPPFFCPECGMHLLNRVVSYPYDHDCEGFKMMKAATKIKCKFDDCNIIFQPNEYRTHFKTHLKKVYRCSFCLEMWLNETETKCTLCKNGNISSYFQCPLCPNKLFVENRIVRHLNTHCSNVKETLNNQIYPCMSCNLVFETMFNLINHHVVKHTASNLKNLLSKFMFNSTSARAKNLKRNVYHRVIKKCSKCLRNFTYRCLYKNIENLSNECPYKCSKINDVQDCVLPNESNDDLYIVCFLCKSRISQNWDNVKAHYVTHHKNHKCLDVKVSVKRLDSKLFLAKSNSKHFKNSKSMIKNKLKKSKVDGNKDTLITKRKDDELKELPINQNVCIVCKCNCENKQTLEAHMITHRDPCMAYQCLECGQCFVVKPSFSTHLLLDHGIPNVQEYIDNKPCYNELAMLKNQNNLNSPIEEPLHENQCRICREQFENSVDLDKHFRVHGMAFLMKNANKNSSP